MYVDATRGAPGIGARRMPSQTRPRHLRKKKHRTSPLCFRFFLASSSSPGAARGDAKPSLSEATRERVESLHLSFLSPIHGTCGCRHRPRRRWHFGSGQSWPRCAGYRPSSSSSPMLEVTRGLPRRRPRASRHLRFVFPPQV
jgi:hypothetical protein